MHTLLSLVLILIALQQTPAPPSDPSPAPAPAPAPKSRSDDRLPMNVRLPAVTLRDDQFVAVDAAAKAGIADTDAILGVTIGKESRAYPIAVVAMHEVVNDELAGVAIAITW
jgi:hypothetical protein